MTQVEQPHGSLKAIVLLAWLPLAILLPLATSQQTSDPRYGLWFGAWSAAVGGVLMVGLWALSGRWNQPERFRFPAFLAHAVIAIGFAITWRAGVLVLTGLQTPTGGLATLQSAFVGPLMLWDLMFKLLVYSLTISLSYAVRQHDAARTERLRAAQLDALATKAQLAAVQAQLNPHFLFNTLHSLSVLIRREPAVAESAVDQLSDLLRYALRHTGHNDIAFKEELQFVRNYLALEQLRLEQRLRLMMDIDPGALAVRVPPFCLQPLVENAIRHGIAPVESGGCLWISARLDRGALRLHVRDDGLGMVPTHGRTTGSGLSSLQQRLEARGGGLEIGSSQPRGFGVTVHLPFDTDDVVAGDTQAVAAS